MCGPRTPIALACCVTITTFWPSCLLSACCVVPAWLPSCSTAWGAWSSDTGLSWLSPGSWRLTWVLHLPAPLQDRVTPHLVEVPMSVTTAAVSGCSGASALAVVAVPWTWCPGVCLGPVPVLLGSWWDCWALWRFSLQLLRHCPAGSATAVWCCFLPGSALPLRSRLLMAYALCAEASGGGFDCPW